MTTPFTKRLRKLAEVSKYLDGCDTHPSAMIRLAAELIEEAERALGLLAETQCEGCGLTVCEVVAVEALTRIREAR